MILFNCVFYLHRKESVCVFFTGPNVKGFPHRTLTLNKDSWMPYFTGFSPSFFRYLSLTNKDWNSRMSQDSLTIRVKGLTKRRKLFFFSVLVSALYSEKKFSGTRDERKTKLTKDPSCFITKAKVCSQPILFIILTHRQPPPTPTIFNSLALTRSCATLPTFS